MTKNAFSQISPSRNVQNSTSRPTLEVFSIPDRIKKSRQTHWKAQNSPKTSKLDPNRPKNFPKNRNWGRAGLILKKTAMFDNPGTSSKPWLWSASGPDNLAEERLV